MKIEQVVPDSVDVPERLRSLQPDKVGQLAESMAAIGLQQPITVWSEAGDHLELIAGRHRVAAAIKLGWDYIDCIFVDGWSEIDRQLWEIDENLMRAELSTSERDDHLIRRKELWEKNQAGQVGPIESKRSDGRGHRSEGFAAETAAATGMSKRAINRATSRGKAIPGDIRAIIKGTKLDTGTYLDSLKGMEPEDQRAKVIADLEEPKKPKPRKGKPTIPTDSVEREFEALKWQFRQKSHELQRRFKAWVLKQKTPVSDDEADHDRAAS